MPRFDSFSDADGAPVRRGLMRTGVFVAATGALAVALPVAATLTAEVAVAILMFLSGCAGMALGLSLGRGSARRWALAISAACLVAGPVMIVFPFAGLRALTLLLVAVLIIEGAASLVMAGRLAGVLPGVMWMAFSGAAALAVAVLILLGWPDTASWALGLLIGVNLLSTGLALFLVGRALPRGRA